MKASLFIDTDQARNDLPFDIMQNGYSLVLYWSPDRVTPIVKVTLSQEAKDNGVYIRCVQHCNTIKFEGEATMVQLWLVRPGEQLKTELFFQGKENET